MLSNTVYDRWMNDCGKTVWSKARVANSLYASQCTILITKLHETRLSITTYTEVSTNIHC